MKRGPSPADEIAPGHLVLAVDPGRDKCGVAVVAHNGTVHERRVVPVAYMQSAVHEIAQAWVITQVVLGDSTTSQQWHTSLTEWLPVTPLQFVDETGSTLAARHLYWQANPPRGWRRLLPLSLQIPPDPVDDFAAVILAQRFFENARP